MFSRGIERVGRRAVCAAAIDGVLAPDDGVCHVNILFLRKIFQRTGGQESAHDAVRSVSSSDQVRDFRKRFRYFSVNPILRKVHGGKITRKITDFVAIAVMAFYGVLSNLDIVFAWILQSVQGKAPSQAAVRIVLGECFAEGGHTFQCVPVRFFTGMKFYVTGDFPRCRPDHQAERDIPSAVQVLRRHARESAENQGEDAKQYPFHLVLVIRFAGATGSFS